MQHPETVLAGHRHSPKRNRGDDGPATSTSSVRPHSESVLRNPLPMLPSHSPAHPPGKPTRNRKCSLRPPIVRKASNAVFVQR